MIGRKKEKRKKSILVLAERRGEDGSVVMMGWR